VTMLIFTVLSVTRKIERGTMEGLIATPITPFEIMIGKIVPYIAAGFVQATLVIGLFGMPIAGSLLLLAVLSTLFIATDLAAGYTISTVAQNQLQAIQMAMISSLPKMLLSGFMFPFAGMPRWVQMIGEFMPRTHYLVRAICRKDRRWQTCNSTP
jgi:ABC-2 type transport system permease protein